MAFRQPINASTTKGTTKHGGKAPTHTTHTTTTKRFAGKQNRGNNLGCGVGTVHARCALHVYVCVRVRTGFDVVAKRVVRLGIRYVNHSAVAVRAVERLFNVLERNVPRPASH